MSIVVLKRKTEAMRNLSGKSKHIKHTWAIQGPHGGMGGNVLSYGGGFSINGSYRNIGSVGTTNLAKSVKRTQFYGTTAKTNSGTTENSNFNYHNSGSCCSNDNTIIKPSVLSTRGMLAKKHRWMKRGYPHYWVQPTGNPLDSTASAVVEKIKTNNLCQSDAFDSGNVVCNSVCKLQMIGTKKQTQKSYSKSRDLFSRSQSDYLTNKKQKCLNPTGANKPFPFQVNNSGMNKYYLRVEDV
jgi:hypothetical protein